MANEWALADAARSRDLQWTLDGNERLGRARALQAHDDALQARDAADRRQAWVRARQEELLAGIPPAPFVARNQPGRRAYDEYARACAAASRQAYDEYDQGRD